MEYDAQTIASVWEKARVMPDQDPVQWRRDACGAWMHRDQYGGAGEYGWRIENVAAGGRYASEDLQPYHHANGYDIENARPRCRVAADRSGLGPDQSLGKPRNAGL
jgi:hypothetical protein